jgi:hypothetical protein
MIAAELSGQPGAGGGWSGPGGTRPCGGRVRLSSSAVSISSTWYRRRMRSRSIQAAGPLSRRPRGEGRRQCPGRVYDPQPVKIGFGARATRIAPTNRVRAEQAVDGDDVAGLLGNLADRRVQRVLAVVGAARRTGRGRC